MRQSELILVLDRARAQRLHQAGRCCHDLTYPELLDELGMTYEIAQRPAEVASMLQGAKYVLLAEFDGVALAGALQDWVRDGGVLLGFMTRGLDALFGVECAGYKVQPDDEFTMNAYAQFYEPGWVPEGRRYRLPVISPVRLVRATAGRAVAGLLQPVSFNLYATGPDREATFSDGIVVRALGKGLCCYFASSVAHTTRALRQGRPVDRDWDGDGMYRTADGIVLTSAHDLQEPFADDYLHILQALFDRAGLLSLHVFPPLDGAVSDGLFFYGGDDECDPSGVQEIAIEKMRRYGLPYHINIMCNADRSGFAVSRELFERMKAYGQEPSIHFDFFRPGGRYTKAEFEEQLDLYEAYFGETPKVYVTHCVMFFGWTETARWCAERGILGDTGKFPARLMHDPNPINTFGFPFGTSYPNYVYDDALHGDKRLNYLSMPIILYEPRINAQTRERDQAILAARIEASIENAWMLPMFFHPVYVARDPAANAAIEQMLSIVERNGYRIVHMGADALAVWWGERRESALCAKGGGAYHLDVRAERGAIVRIPAGERPPICTLDGKSVRPEAKTIAGRPAWFVPVGFGLHALTIEK